MNQAASVEDDFLVSEDNGIIRAQFNRPRTRNALTFEMYEGLADLCRNVEADGSVKAIIVSGSDERAFAAGTDMAQFRDFSTPEDALAYEKKIEGILEAIETCPVPTIAAISGACTGGGAGIAVACDLRIASADARFGFPIARTLGNCLSLANYARLVSLIGAGRVMDLILMARLVPAEEARAIGLISEVLPDHAAVMARAGEMAETLGGHAPLTMRATKTALRRIRRGEHGDSDFVVQCYTSEDFKEGMEAFLGKRAPVWKGR
ncbi:MAG: enoyl-CoA hydratase/isomerase family protein [Rhodobiaceae bacterium]|nr:enoyl-CoA hydratase/isomerase family protein [Rhodobiaceae bacterium]MCC0016801.1 enoyl-CoA hydratase/isomerase family protein [Rhodobiaceae bacterium]MCC0041503.1 enoyl-CoA hydratase/isomerase family protein [Rhodobiaceae bacterium]